jgi:hypothetical protein
VTLNSVNLDDLTGIVSYILTDTGTDHDRTDESGNTADSMDTSGTCEIDEA